MGMLTTKEEVKVKITSIDNTTVTLEVSRRYYDGPYYVKGFLKPRTTAVRAKTMTISVGEEKTV